MALYIISDLHLSAKAIDVCKAFEVFTKNMFKNDRLIIAGDLFDYFVGIDNNDKAQLIVKEALGNAYKRGIKCGFIRGNRDFLMTEEDAKYFNMQLLPDIYVIQTLEGPTLVTHGDIFCTNDSKYQRYRKLVTSPTFKKFFLALPLSTRKRMAQKIRDKSKQKHRLNMDTNTTYGIDTESVEKYLVKYNATNVIHGHIHILAKFKHESENCKLRVSLGSWDGAFSYVRSDRNAIAVVQKNMDTLI